MGILAWISAWFGGRNERLAFSAVERFQRDNLRRGIEGADMINEAHLRMALARLRRELSEEVARDPSVFEARLVELARAHGERIYYLDKSLARKWATWVKTLGPADVLLPDALKLWRLYYGASPPTCALDAGIVREAFR